MPVVRWKFDDPVTSESYTFTYNPSEDGTPMYQKNLIYQSTSAPNGRVITFEGRDELREAEISGVILDQETLEEMYYWYTKRYPIMLTDDLGREFKIYITAFEPRRVRAATKPWKHEYTMRYTYMEGEFMAITPPAGP